MDKLLKMKVGNVSFQLRKDHNFEWLRELGEVFTVFDEQDSGNICFGVKKDGVKKFVKYAGAKTKKYKGQPKDAINALKHSVSIYEELKDNHLIDLLDHFETNEGYVLVFEWFEGECLHTPSTFPPPHKYTDPASPYYKFKELPIEYRLQSFSSILAFHLHVERKNYAAVDFYDGSILYDFKNNVTKICDIDFYQVKPFINDMGRLWGSSRFMSPEEFELGAVIDGRTNVFTMGAIAFSLLGGEVDRSILKWDAGEKLHQIAMQAVDLDKEKRYSSIKQFYHAWHAVLD